MATSGALLGPVLDGFHSRFGVLKYHSPPPFSVQLGGFEICETAAWVPPMFGLAGIIIGSLYVVLDRVVGTPAEKQAPSASTVVFGIIFFILQYFLSGLLLGPAGLLGSAVSVPDPWTQAWWLVGAAEIFLWAYGVAHWAFFDGSRVGLVVAVLTALGGPIIELGLLHVPGWDLYAYANPDFFSIPAWICAVYFAGGPAVGNLARSLLRSMEART